MILKNVQRFVDPNTYQPMLRLTIEMPADPIGDLNGTPDVEEHIARWLGLDLMRELKRAGNALKSK